MEKPNARGPSPARKAERALGPKLNRKPKLTPDSAGGKNSENPPDLPARLTEANLV